MRIPTHGRPAVDVHSRLTEAKAAIDGLRALCVPQSEERLSYLTGFQLDMLLRPISDTLEDCLHPSPATPAKTNLTSGVL